MLFRNYLPLEKGGAQHLNKLHPRMLCAKEGWNWPTGSEEEDFLICQCIFTISKLSPLGKGWGPSFEQTRLHLIKEWFEPSLVEIVPVAPERKIFKICQCILPFRHYLPLENHLWTNLNPLTQGKFEPSLVEICPVVLEKKMKMLKVYNNNDNADDNNSNNKGQIVISKAHLSLWWAKM